MNESPEHSRPPEIFQADWNREQVAALFDDLERGAIVKHVQVRTPSGAGLQDAAVTLRQAQELLDAGAAQAIQIHYDFEGRTWCDTLLASPDSVRIIRTPTSRFAT